MKCQADLTVSLAGETELRGLASVLAPDNRDLPRGLSLATSASGMSLKYVIASESASTCLSTTIALLRDIALFQEVWLLSEGHDARVHRG